MPQPMDIPSQQHCLARALYDNIPDTPDELHFRKGDTLTVLEQNTANIEGWWLCSLRGKQGICPANRLRLIPGAFEDRGQQSRGASPYNMIIEQGDQSYLQRQGKRRSWHVHPNQVITPRKFNDVYLYDMPPSRNSPHHPGTGAQGSPSPPPSRNYPQQPPGTGTGTGAQGSPSPPPTRTFPQQPPGTAAPSPPSFALPSDVVAVTAVVAVDVDLYDVPPSAVPVGDGARGCLRCSPLPSTWDSRSSTWCKSLCKGGRDNAGESYDVPRPLIGNHLSPSISNTSLPTTNDSSSSTPSNRSSSSSAAAADYDVPRPHHRRGAAPDAQLPPPPTAPNKQLPLELGSALESLERLQADTAGAISKLLGFVGPRWRARDRLEPVLLEVRLAVTRLRASLHDLAEFGEGALGNAARASDKNLAGKLAPLVSALRKSDSLVQEASDRLSAHNWSLEVLSRPEGGDKTRKPDELEQLVACSRALTEDIRQIASFIQGNGLLLFKKERPASGSDEYDYVSFESKEAVSKGHADILQQLPQPLQQGYDACVKHADAVALEGDHRSVGLDADDRQLLVFYATQAVTHHDNLTHAIDAFLHTVEHNQPPRIFLAHGKFVVLSAHKLVLIGDTVHKNVSRRDVREGALRRADALSDALAASVHKTKQAAMQFPSVAAVQDMVDSIVDISHSAKELKVCLVQAAVPL